uniref:DUF5688 family protein n=1 Tax=Agathobacter sp. TaxID=2021311 RepID=UPI004056A268
MFTGLQEFTEMVKNELGQRMPECQILSNDVAKNNGITLKGLMLHKAGDSISPQVYMNGYYADYRNGRGMESICAEIMTLYNAQADPVVKGMDVSQVTNFEAVKDNICFRLVNYKKNETQLQTMPHRKFLDLAIVYIVSVQFEDANGSIRVTDHLLAKWGVCEQTLYDIAVRNTPRCNEWIVKPLKDVVAETLQEKSVSCTDEMLKDFDFPFFIATNTQKLFGAAVLLYPEITRKMSRLLGNCNLYILPSSVHEVIILEELKEIEPKELIQTVREVNRADVQPEEMLSDNIYFYDARNDNLLVLTE